ncbi:hypothetical protein BCR32DRAFT_295200 [Anaeromyces robustus]|uniref:Uncharacterized protein n=1 Tax=Anaeromyces robustus TaxID=1754192 RepID=A0A1Y1WX87_9FUNG|nr:hypothetical protein BCR32DRAFT_295200 [Anaeromyces robustus]|eukprot:ORX78150.1 hypothetical protein BCR32DRAFT_295200 [Anaeromyces robustus]
MKLTTFPSTKTIINNNDPTITLSQIVYPTLIISLTLFVPTILYYIFKLTFKKENIQISFLSLINTIKEWKYKLTSYHVTILQNTRLSNDNDNNEEKTSLIHSSSLSPEEEIELKNLAKNEDNSQEYSNLMEEDTIISSSKKGLLYTKIIDRSSAFYKKCQDISLKRKKLFNILPIQQSYIYNFLRNNYYIIQYFILSYINIWKIRIDTINKKLLWPSSKNQHRNLQDELDEKKEIENQVFENDITAIFNNSFDDLLTLEKIDSNEIDTTSGSSSITTTTTTSTTSNNTNDYDHISSSHVKHNNKKFHFDYYNRKIVFHPDSLYHEQNAKKYNTSEGNFEKNQLFSSVTLVLTTGNHQKLSYFPRFPWYWDGVELFNGISINPRPFIHPNYLSTFWKPKERNYSNHQISKKPSTSTSTSSSKSSSSSSSSIISINNNENNRKNFTLSLTRKNSF